MSEQEIEELENQFPALAELAFAAARKRVLESGQSVLETDNGVIYEVFPDGHRVEVEKIEPPTKVVPGTIIKIK